MGEFKGTKGPWLFAINDLADSDNGSIVNDDAHCVCYFGDDEQYYPTGGIAPSDYDMALILSAPNMLAALQSIIECFDCTDGRVWTNSSKRRALDAAHAAVKLALGEK